MPVSSAETRRRAETALAGGAALLGLGLLFVVLAARVAAGHLDGWDLRVLEWVAERRTEALTAFFLAITYLGSKTLLSTLLVGIVGGLVLARRWAPAVMLVVAMAGTTVLVPTLKHLFARPRPPIELMIAPTDGYAFPSGHTVDSVTFFVGLALIVATHVARTLVRAFLVFYALAVGALVAASRIYLGVHYASDVVAGLIVGCAWSGAVVLAEHILGHRRGAAARGPDAAPPGTPRATAPRPSG